MIEKILQTHTKDTFLYATSRALERATFYGIRAVIIFYMLSEVIEMEREEAYKLYGVLVASFTFVQVFGAILGDLILGNRKAIFIGGVLNALGAFCLCIPSIYGLYLGLFLMVLGGALYVPNINSNFGKLYLSRPKLLDAGFTIIYFSINIGAFVGALLLSYCREEFGWNTSFVTGGIIMLLALIPLLFVVDKKDIVIKESSLTASSNLRHRIVYIAIILTTVGILWGLYEIGNYRFFDVSDKLRDLVTLKIPKMLWELLNVVFIVPLSVLAIIGWTYFYSSQIFKLTLGFVFGVISFGLLFLIPETPTAQHVVYYVVSFICLAISEVHIGPVIQSILTQYGNPKYLAILMSVSFIPGRLFSLIIGFYNETFTENPVFAIKLGLIVMSIVCVALILFFVIGNKNNTRF